MIRCGISYVLFPLQDFVHIRNVRIETGNEFCPPPLPAPAPQNCEISSLYQQDIGRCFPYALGVKPIESQARRNRN